MAVPSCRLVFTNFCVTIGKYRDPSLALRMTGGRQEGKYVTFRREAAYVIIALRAIPQPSGPGPVKLKNPPAFRPVNLKILPHPKETLWTRGALRTLPL